MKAQFVEPDPPTPTPESADEDRVYQMDLEDQERYSEVDPIVGGMLDIAETFLKFCRAAQEASSHGVSIDVADTAKGLKLMINITVPTKKG